MATSVDLLPIELPVIIQSDSMTPGDIRDLKE
jgi:hypothetical protein